MSTLATNAITDASGGNTTSINGYTPTMSNMAGRNRIINGDMRIDQRNAGASVTPSIQSVAYITDRFYFLQNSSTLPSIQQSTDAPEGFTNSLLFTNTSTGTTPAYAQVVQNIEGHNTADLGWGTANAQAITASFRVKSSLTGTFSVAFRNASVNRSYVTTYTISAPNTWETKTVTVPGDTSGTWLTNNGTGISFIFGLGASSGTPTVDQWTTTGNWYLSGSVNVMGTANATWQITGVQLEAGSVATPFEHRQYGQELALCQRYFAKSYNQSVAPGTASNYNGAPGRFVDATQSYAAVQVFFPVSMRATPTATLYNPSTGATASLRSDSANHPAVVTQQGENGFFFFANNSSIGVSSSCRAHYAASAEL